MEIIQLHYIWLRPVFVNVTSIFPSLSLSLSLSLTLSDSLWLGYCWERFEFISSQRPKDSIQLWRLFEQFHAEQVPSGDQAQMQHLWSNLSSFLYLKKFISFLYHKELYLLRRIYICIYIFIWRKGKKCNRNTKENQRFVVVATAAVIFLVGSNNKESFLL